MIVFIRISRSLQRVMKRNISQWFFDSLISFRKFIHEFHASIFLHFPHPPKCTNEWMEYFSLCRNGLKKMYALTKRRSTFEATSKTVIVEQTKLFKRIIGVVMMVRFNFGLQTSVLTLIWWTFNYSSKELRLSFLKANTDINLLTESRFDL